MKIGVISDTHDQDVLIENAVRRFNEEQVGLVVHCGDWVSPFILYSFKELKAPIKGVFGNNDGDKFRHLVFSGTFGLDLQYEDRFLELDIDRRRIAVFHGDYPGLVDALVKCGKYDAVFHGHTHQRILETHGRTLSLNPGSLMRSTLGQAFGASIAIYDTSTNQATHIDMF
jgi:uncharacterized protein